MRERIDICHGHQATSMTTLHVFSVAKALGLKTVYTDHSLFSFNDMAGISLNKLNKWNLKELDAAIAVSHTCKENFCLRNKIDPNICFAIPNSVDTVKFRPANLRE